MTILKRLICILMIFLALTCCTIAYINIRTIFLFLADVALFYILSKKMNRPLVIDKELAMLEDFADFIQHIEVNMNKNINLELIFLRYLTETNRENYLDNVICNFVKYINILDFRENISLNFCVEVLVYYSILTLYEIYKKSFDEARKFIYELKINLNLFKKYLKFISVKANVIYFRSKILTVLISFTNAAITMLPMILRKYLLMENFLLFIPYPFIIYLFLNKIDDNGAFYCSILSMVVYFLSLKILFIVMSWLTQPLLTF